MKLNNAFKLKKIGGQTVIVSLDKKKPLNDNIVLNESAVFLWNKIQQNPDITKEGLLNSLLDEFDISTVLALSNIDILLKILKQNKILED